MKLKNHTSSVPIDTTIARIERMLIDAGATGIGKQIENGQVTAIIFNIAFEPDAPAIPVRLPANVDRCQEAFWKDHCQHRSMRSTKTDKDFREQAARTAWKLQQDWVEVQVSLMKLQQQDAMQAFLAYAWDGRQTFYERVKESGFAAMLPEKTEAFE